ncbi:MAG TPA: glycogen debranching N-terminal domain-containing protein, partial [Ktedonobacterales bacterium]|nr:glycogen debranching N-terminal domain-containing protein [Ktedonobacterales bacterium]
HGTLVIQRRQTLDAGLREALTVTNYSNHEATCMLELQCDADFGHIFAIKYAVEVGGGQSSRNSDIRRAWEADDHALRLDFNRQGITHQLVIRLSQTPEIVDGLLRFPLRLAPQEHWDLQLEFQMSSGTEGTSDGKVLATSDTVRRERHNARRAMVLQTATQLTTDSEILRRAYRQSIADIAALLMEDPNAHDGEFIIAAGIPWFLTLFGRDSLITALQILPIFPEVAKGVLHALARLQGTKVDVARVEQPGKILHEYRRSAFASTENSAAIFPYYGTIDATPLFLLLLSAVWRVAGDRDFIVTLREPMERALAWIDDYGDRDGDGYLEYLRETTTGLENQGWKDAGDAICFRDGTLARAPIALCEVQGYVYAARLGVAEIYDALGEPEMAQDQRQRAASLRARFNQDFWMTDRQYFALALDADKQQVDVLASNAGHLLWCGIVEDDKAPLLVKRMMSDAFFSGWGIRTIASGEGAYIPIGYHRGTVWPHDNSLILAGLTRYGFIAEAKQLADGMIATLENFPDARFPELFAGFSRLESSFPVEYPTASRPQAWSSGAVLLLLLTMTGFNAITPTLANTPFLPSGVQQLALTGLPFSADLHVGHN